MTLRWTGTGCSIQGEKVKDVRMYLPPRMTDQAQLLVEGIRNYKQLGCYGSFGVLLKGMAGTGKTLFARYVVQETDSLIYHAPMISDPGTVADIFNSARRGTQDHPAIILFDDLDYIGKRSEGTSTAYRPVLAQLLQEMDVHEKNIGVFTFITSNLPDLLDEALRRPPRVTYELEFFPPNSIERKKMLEAILSGNAVNIRWSEQMIEHASAITFGYTPGDLLGVVQNATMQAIVRIVNKKAGQKQLEEITKTDIDLAKKMQKPSAIRDLPFIEPSETLDDIVGGYAMRQKRMLGELGVRIDNGILVILFGPTGCGKTALARAVAGHFGYNCLYFNPSDIVDKYVGEAGKALSRAFNRAKALGPCVLIIDQAEGIINPENPYAKEWTSVIKAELSEPIPNVFVIMTTTNPSDWGDEILGRFHKIYLPQADERSQADIFRKYLAFAGKQAGGADGIDVLKIITESKGALTPRDIKTVIKSIQDFGGEITTETLVKTTGCIPPRQTEINYDKLVDTIGDDSKIFAAIKG